MVKRITLNLDDDVDAKLRKTVDCRKGALQEYVNHALRVALGMAVGDEMPRRDEDKKVE